MWETAGALRGWSVVVAGRAKHACGPLGGTPHCRGMWGMCVQGGIDAFFKYDGPLGCWWDEAKGTHTVAGR